jgi:protein-tyrosine-phosphatase
VSAEPESDRALAILVVCTANQCRSPIGEFMFRSAAAQTGLAVTVSSAGTHAVEDLEVHPSAAAVLAEHDIEIPPTWVTTRLTAQLAAGADLILTATAEHRRAVVLTSPGAMKRSFTLLEWARLAPLLGGLPTEPAEFRATLPKRVAAARGTLQPNPTGDDIADPIGQRYEVFRDTGDTIAAAVVAAIGPLSPALPG